MKRKSLNSGMAIAFGAAVGAALGAATGHMAGWVAMGVATGAAIALAGRNNSVATCGSSDEKLNPPADTH
jgi:hypothetical protein